MSTEQESFVSRLSALTVGGLVAATMLVPMTASATIHEMVAAFCSGGGQGVISAEGFLAAPGVSDPTKPQSFAKPVSVNGVVDDSAGFPFVIGSSPAAKFPAGDPVLGPTGLLVSESQHPSALHCPKAADLP